jgi:hypothetical protein
MAGVLDTTSKIKFGQLLEAGMRFSPVPSTTNLTAMTYI